jgi:Glycosyl transferase family 2
MIEDGIVVGRILHRDRSNVFARDVKKNARDKQAPSRGPVQARSPHPSLPPASHDRSAFGHHHTLASEIPARRCRRKWDTVPKAIAAIPPHLQAPASTRFRPAILIPAYDCGATLGAVLTGARLHELPILVVDDGSRDDTAAVARAAGADVIQHARNRGKGAALMTGMHALAEREFTHVLTMDGDGQHLAREIPVLLAEAVTDPTAIVIGVRRRGNQEVAGINLFGNRFANLCVQSAAGVPLPDTQSGFRVYPLATMLGLPKQGEHFEYESTSIIFAARARVPIRSLPVDVFYPPVTERRSHYRKVVDTLRIIRAVAPLLVRR